MKAMVPRASGYPARNAAPRRRDAAWGKLSVHTARGARGLRAGWHRLM